MLFCFFKQKTAYEMRISDWSSDVCSSDLGNGGEKERAWTRRRIVIDRPHRQGRRWMGEVCRSVIKLFGYGQGEAMGGGPLRNHVTFFGKGIARTVHYGQRSEEHTSELQSLMRISYAVFCLNIKTKTYC